MILVITISNSNNTSMQFGTNTQLSSDLIIQKMMRLYIYSTVHFTQDSIEKTGQCDRIDLAWGFMTLNNESA